MPSPSMAQVAAEESARLEKLLARLIACPDSLERLQIYGQAMQACQIIAATAERRIERTAYENLRVAGALAAATWLPAPRKRSQGGGK